MPQLPLKTDERFPLIAAYRITHFLYESQQTLIARGVQLADNQPVVLKWLKEKFPAAHQRLRLRNYYTIAKRLNVPGVVRPLSLATSENSLVLVMPDQGYLALSEYIATQPLNLKTCLAIAIQFTEILHALYQHRVIHQAIQPAHLLIHPETNQIQLIDFSLASRLPKEMEAVQHPNLLEGNLSYLAPEQTGRMNRGIDYRADFYSFGVTLFELLTGQLPFQSADPLELVYCHIARPAPSICDFKPDLPPPLAQIVAKLLAKNAEDRYQSALGLKYDLEQVLNQLAQTGHVQPFAIAARDISDRLLIPEKLYGREPAVAALLAAFERVAEGQSELVLVTGASGVGKTAVINEVHKPIVQQRGYFIKGKFDQFRLHLPLSAFVQAFRDLITQLLAESEAQLQAWRFQILSALGENAQVIVEVIPELEQIIGQQPPLPELSGKATQNRFNLTFEKFIQVFTTSAHPLVIFLDDLQWADLASLKLMQLLISQPEQGYRLLIGAYRDNEVSATQPLFLALNEIQSSGAILHPIALEPLNLSDVNDLVADTLSCTPDLALPLAELVYQKTQGNPFFTHQFLKTLQQEGLISFNQERGCWQCDLAQIEALSLNQDVIEFMAIQLQKLPEQTQAALKLAACIGNTFDLETFAIIYQRSPAETATHLWEALQAGLLLPQRKIYQFFSNGVAAESALFTPDKSQVPTYRFSHDRVQQAAYSLIPEPEKQATHLQIGQLLLQTASTTEAEEWLFESIHHLQLGRALMTAPAERENLAQLCLRAGRKAKMATAYEAAVNYLTRGIDLLSPDRWEQHYDLTLALHQEITEACYLNTDFEAVNAWAALVLEHARTLLDRIKVYETQIFTAKAQGRLLESLQMGLHVLQALGIAFPSQPTATDIEAALAATRQLWQGRSPLQLLDLPTMLDPQHLAAMQMMTVLVPSAYMAAPNVLPLLICKQVELSIHNGNCPISSYTYADYGLMLCGMDDLEAGYDFGQLALQILERFQAMSCKARTGFIVHHFISHWKEPLRHVLPSLQAAYQSGLASGDLEGAGFAIYVYCCYSFFAGQELVALVDEIDAYRQTSCSFKQELSLKHLETLQQTVLNLLGASPVAWKLGGPIYDTERSLPVQINHADQTGLFYVYFSQTLLAYLFGHYKLAAQQAAFMEQHRNSVAAQFTSALASFYAALVQLAQWHELEPEQQPQILEQVQQQQANLHRWARLAPFNHQHRWELVEAERCRVLGDCLGAMEHYDQAIHLAKEQGFTQDESLANELAARFYRDWGRDKIAQTYLIEAYNGYTRWGANAKVADLENRYPQLLAPILERSRPHRSALDRLPTNRETAATVPGIPVQHITEDLDLATVIKASHTLASEIQLDKLLIALTNVLAENAGAQKCALILLKDNQLILEVLTQVETEGALLRSTCPSIPIANSSAIPDSVIHYVRRTLEAVVLEDLPHQTAFAADAYLLQQRPKSLLGMPILNQGKLLGVLYLENNLTTGAFSRDRLVLLKLLSTQAAISLQNAQLYQQSQSYAHQIESSLAQLQASETRFRHLAANIPGAIFQLRSRLDDRYVDLPYISSGCYELYGVTAEAMMAGAWALRDFEHPDDRYRMDQAIRQSAENLTPFREEFRIVTPAGIVKWVQAVSQPEQQPDGLITWDGVVLDISDRKRLEQEQIKLNTILESASDYIGIANAQGQVLWMNRHLKQFLPHQHLTNSQPLQISDFHPQWASDIIFHQGIPTAIQNGTWLGETVLLDATGREVPVSQLIIAHKSEQGEVEYCSTIMRDIRDLKAAEDQLKQQARQLEQANRQLAEYSQTLEQKVAERTQELSQTLAHLQATQQELLHSEKMAVLGQLTSSIAHEINTPLGVIRGAASNITAALQASLQQLPTLLQRLSATQQSEFLALINTAAQTPQLLSTREERQLRHHWQTELEAQGIRNAEAIAFQLTLLQLKPDLSPYLSLLEAANCAEILQVANHLVLQQQNVRSIQQEVNRAAKIAFALKTYSHSNQTKTKNQVAITDSIEVALTLYKHRLKRGIEVMRRYDANLTPIVCNPDELTQVWVNLIDNAIYSMGQQGMLEVAVTQSGDRVVVQVSDTGAGIPPEIQPRIFDPFFTTKARGEGSGLGLDIVRRLVQNHAGDIQVHSQPGHTTFTVELPLALNDVPPLT